MFANVYVILKFVKGEILESMEIGQKTKEISELLLGCIADDITGASDIGLMLASNGLPTTLFLGIPDEHREITTPAVVIALKIRTVPADEAVAQASAAADWLLSRKARQLFYKYCSTFDSTSDGNIGPITNALLNKVDENLTVLLPAFPENKRTVRNGYLYVDDVPLHRSAMRNHPLTPMTDSYLPRLMDSQTSQGLTGLVASDIVVNGVAAIKSALAEKRAAGNRYVVIDTRSDDDMRPIAEAIADLKLITGGSGIGSAIPETLRGQRLLDPEITTAVLPKLPGNAAVIAGSCSEATRAQITTFADAAIPIVVDPALINSGNTYQNDIADQAIADSKLGDVIVYSSTDPDRLRQIQKSIGVDESAALVENALAFVARRLSDSGIRKFVVAGGETSGAVARALDVDELEIGEQIDPGVPWMVTKTSEPTCLAFKSGNFGRPDFFQCALELLP